MRSFQSEELFRNLVETINDWVWEVNETAVYTYVSPQIRTLLGYEPEEVLGKTPFDFMPPLEAQRIAEMFGAIAASQQPFRCLENTSIHKDGSLVVLEASGAPFFDPDGTWRGYRGVDRDISDHQRMERELGESKTVVRALYRVATNPQLGLIESLQQVIAMGCQYFGLDYSLLSRVEGNACELIVVQTPDNSVAIGDIYDLRQAYCLEVLQQTEPLWIPHASVSEWCHHPGYAGFHMETYFGMRILVNTKVYGVLCFCSKVPSARQFRSVDNELLKLMAQWIGSELQRYEVVEALHVRENQYRSVVNNVKEVIFKMDVTGQWTFLNPSWTEITGFSLDESLGKDFLDFVHPDDQQDNVLALFQPSTTRQMDGYRNEVRYLTKDGSFRWLEVNARLTLDANACLIGFCGTLNDINERKQALSELRQTQAQLIQSEKMSSLGQMVAGMAHEINNPINFIYGNIEYTKKYLQDLFNLVQLYQHQYPHPTPIIQAQTEEINLAFIAEDLPKIFSSVKIGAERIRDLVLSLRNFSRIDSSDVKQVDLHEGIDNTLLILNHQLTAGITVSKQYGKLPLVECYPALNQVFMNILTNAIDALLELVEQPDKQIAIQTEMVSPLQVDVRIRDNGPGIPLEIQSKIFDPFFTTKDVGKGTGLGLSICYQVIEKHRGQIAVNSRLGQGTEFVITLPVKWGKTGEGKVKDFSTIIPN